jgi:hypothetical protein
MLEKLKAVKELLDNSKEVAYIDGRQVGVLIIGAIRDLYISKGWPVEEVDQLVDKNYLRILSSSIQTTTLS